MPTLNKRRGDGGYYLRHRYMDHNTWQITGDGVGFLQRRHVTEDAPRFSTDLFMELWRRGFVYYGGELPHSHNGPLQEQPLVTSLRSRAGEFYSAVFAGDESAARGFLVDDLSIVDFTDETQLFDEFTRQVRQIKSKSWIVFDARVFAGPLISEDSGRTYVRGETYVRLRLTNNSDTEHELRQNWLNYNGEWFLWSVDFRLPDAA